MDFRQTIHNAIAVTNSPSRFRVTHPFHPFYGEEFETISMHRAWRRLMLVFKTPDGSESYIPVEWTDAAQIDPFIVISEGRSFFRVELLIEMAELIRELDL